MDAGDAGGDGGVDTGADAGMADMGDGGAAACAAF